MTGKHPKSEVVSSNEQAKDTELQRVYGLVNHWYEENKRLQHAFKNFHRLLCERFDYGHDEKDWQRDQLSLIEWIAKRGVHETKPVREPPHCPTCECGAGKYCAHGFYNGNCPHPRCEHTRDAAKAPAAPIEQTRCEHGATDEEVCPECIGAPSANPDDDEGSRQPFIKPDPTKPCVFVDRSVERRPRICTRTMGHVGPCDFK